MFSGIFSPEVKMDAECLRLRNGRILCCIYSQCFPLFDETMFYLLGRASIYLSMHLHKVKCDETITANS